MEEEDEFEDEEVRSADEIGQDGHYMIQPLVELYGGCMVALKVS